MADTEVCHYPGSCIFATGFNAVKRREQLANFCCDRKSYEESDWINRQLAKIAPATGSP